MLHCCCFCCCSVAALYCRRPARCAAAAPAFSANPNRHPTPPPTPPKRATRQQKQRKGGACDLDGWCGGNFDGAASMAGYVKDLGADAVWLSPFARQGGPFYGHAGYHGYCEGERLGWGERERLGWGGEAERAGPRERHRQRERGRGEGEGERERFERAAAWRCCLGQLLVFTSCVPPPHSPQQPPPLGPLPTRQRRPQPKTGPADFYEVDPHFGAAADLARLGDTLRGQGLWVMHDLVVNHVGYGDWAAFRPFNKVGDFHDCNGARYRDRDRERETHAHRAREIQRDREEGTRARAPCFLHRSLLFARRRPYGSLDLSDPCLPPPPAEIFSSRRPPPHSQSLITRGQAASR